MGKWIHVLRELDRETGHAVCKSCGPVVARWRKNKGVFRCPNAEKEQKGYWTEGIGYESTKARAARIASQSGKCAICQNEEPLHRDHDHRTEKDRGFLCRSCNLGLGNFGDNPEKLEAAAEYLRWHGTSFESFQKDVTVTP